MFACKGHEETSLDEIVAETHIAKGTYCYYSLSKSATLEAVGRGRPVFFFELIGIFILISRHNDHRAEFRGGETKDFRPCVWNH